MIEQTITSDQEIDVILAPKTPSGRPAKVDPNTPPTAEVQSGTSTVVPTDNPLKFTLRSSDDPGDTDFLLSADADLGEGVETISEVVRLHVTSPKATSLGVTLGEVRDKVT